MLQVGPGGKARGRRGTGWEERANRSSRGPELKGGGPVKSKLAC